MRLSLFIIVLCCYSISCNYAQNSDSGIEKKPTILIVTLVRNKEHTLPMFLSYLEDLDYPKDRISLWFKSDHNEDNSIEIVETWLKKTKKLYHSVAFKYDKSSKLRKSEFNKTHWPEERFRDIIRMKEEGLKQARNMWADYVFFLDADVFLTSSKILYDLIDLDLPIVAPMLISDGLYSNFWCGMSKDYYYQRTENYTKIRNFEIMGEYQVPMIHSAVLLDLNRESSDLLTFDKDKLNSLHQGTKEYNGPIDDIIIFAISANYSATPMFISNTKNYGYLLVPLDLDEKIEEKDYEQLTNVQLFIVNYYDKIEIKSELRKFVKKNRKDKLTLNEIFMINLERRKERRQKMELSFDLMGLDVQYFPAVDGKKLTDDILKQRKIKLLPEYTDPYHKRAMTMGEVGCFLSHYSIWEKMVQYNLQEVLILEDDIKFEPYFKDRALYVINEARELGGWDLIYFGRKRLQESNEEYLPGSENLVKVGYSYWTLGYLISLSGARKLLNARPLEKLVPVDEFLPIMFNEHPNETWASKFPKRDLMALSVAPLLLFPTHYTGDEGYISDTENSAQIELNEELIANLDKNDKTTAFRKSDESHFLKSSLHDGIKEHSRSEL